MKQVEQKTITLKIGLAREIRENLGFGQKFSSLLNDLLKDWLKKKKEERGDNGQG